MMVENAFILVNTGSGYALRVMGLLSLGLKLKIDLTCFTKLRCHNEKNQQTMTKI